MTNLRWSSPWITRVRDRYQLTRMSRTRKALLRTEIKAAERSRRHAAKLAAFNRKELMRQYRDERLARRLTDPLLQLSTVARLRKWGLIALCVGVVLGMATAVSVSDLNGQPLGTSLFLTIAAAVLLIVFIYTTDLLIQATPPQTKTGLGGIVAAEASVLLIIGLYITVPPISASEGYRAFFAFFTIFATGCAVAGAHGLSTSCTAAERRLLAELESSTSTDNQENS